MSSLNEHVENNADPEKRARDALLAAIAADVEEVAKKTQVDHRTPRLKSLAEAYALVVHGNS
ncbi:MULTISPECIES: hypothetical protein [unclassified Streptomyces]|uniref:hypothetical protein n=1 Tax=unclassified Streptomyces TaxID=2593676 RepID=UPI00093E2A53|nr:hypothetical protein [Streptomyces sp. CB02366]OKJ38199.1 hypothetical protein AMK24_11045 [Streptomyces sp. CB02366]